MYCKHFDFKTLPFENVPDPNFFFNQGEHARIRNQIVESYKANRGLMILTGPIGSGKTTLSQIMVTTLSEKTKLIWIAEPPENSISFLLFITQELGLTPESSDRVFVLRDLREELIKLDMAGKIVLVIIDESHLMSDELLNTIRLLNNLEMGSTKLIKILLLGQDELLETINKPEMAPFKQRIATMAMLGMMRAEQIPHYIGHRISVAGGNPSIFSQKAMKAIGLAFAADGVPRQINTLCDRALHSAFEKGKDVVGVEDVYNAAKSIDSGTEIFHYILELKEQENSATLNELENDTQLQTKSHSLERKSQQGQYETTEIERFEMSSLVDDRKILHKQQSNRIVNVPEQLKRPLFSLILSIVLLVISSIIFQLKSECHSIASCFNTLFGL